MTPLGGTAEVSKQININGKVSPSKQNGTSIFAKQLEFKGKVYKLMIQIDKIRAKPGPKCRKPALLAASRREKMAKIMETFDKQCGDYSPGNIAIKTISKPVRIEPESSESQSDGKIKNQCPVCEEHLEHIVALFDHHKEKHFICQFCDAPFVSQTACDTHENLHENNDPLFIYKCHLCMKSYDCTRNLKIHLKESHWEILDVGWKPDSEQVKGLIQKLIFECGICNTAVSLKSEIIYRNHMALHQGSVPKPTENSPEKISDMHLSDQQNLKLTCVICSQTFNTPDAAEAHTCSSHKLKKKI
uniref:ZFP1 protein n=1 Tax=Fopius arisanus TaxID=64838 RepID=A0A0C9RQZ6_9HYME